MRFILAHAPEGSFRFAARDSAEALAALAAYPDAAGADALILIGGGRALIRSDAALAVAARLRHPWRSLAFLRAIPAPWRDACYDAVARNRYRWFGRVGPG